MGGYFFWPPPWPSWLRRFQNFQSGEQFALDFPQAVFHVGQCHHAKISSMRFGLLLRTLA